jgi:hypothetical protein
MGILEDIVKTLDRIPGWKRIQELPGEVDELNKRVAALEQKLGKKWPGDVCRHCGEQTLRLDQAWPSADAKGYMKEQWKCQNCGKYDTKAYKPGPR